MEPQEVLSAILTDDSRLEAMKKQSSLLARANSTQEICDIIFEKKD